MPTSGFELMKDSLSLSILRLSFLLVLVGFFVPIACNTNGYQLAQGMLGNTQQAANAVFLGSIEDLYGYLFFGVFAFALLGLVLTFLSKGKISFLLGSVCFGASFVLLIVVVLKIKSFRDSAVLHLILTISQIKVKLLIGGYSMAVGYLAGVAAIVSRFMSLPRRAGSR